MSEQITLSENLTRKLLDELKAHDTKCENGLVACQYLSATIAWLISRQNMPATQKAEILEELMEFMRYVLNDMNEQRQAPPAPAADPEKAFGIWRPDD